MNNWCDIYAGHSRQVVHFSAATMVHYSAALDNSGWKGLRPRYRNNSQIGNFCEAFYEL